MLKVNDLVLVETTAGMFVGRISSIEKVPDEQPHQEIWDGGELRKVPLHTEYGTITIRVSAERSIVL